ncbi:hypothetical protein F5Y08DRAFT_320942 [Xylaria arbuscula]|nr:hypothetical protein F5Y08DRAFT_320942 [Xylaria arbuscula]
MTTQPEVRCPRTNALLKQPRSETKTLPIGTLRIVPFPHPPRPLDGGRYVGGKLQVDDNDKKNDDDSSTVSDASTIEYMSASNTSSSSSSSSSKDSNSTVTTESTIKPSSGSNVSTSSNRSNGHKNGSSGSSNLDATAAGPSQPRRRFSLASHLGLFDPLPFRTDLPTELHDGKEPYLLLGPLVVLPEFREFPIGALLWNAAKAWLRAHPGYFDPSVTVLGMQTMQAENTQDIPRWNGLVCVHAREAETEIYEGWGFRIDRGMGRFYKEGDFHVGMFQRLEVKSITSWGRLMESHGKHT